MAKKFKPPTSGRFKPPHEVTGRTAASVVPTTVRSVAPTPQLRCLGSVKTRFDGEETLMTDGTRHWLRVRGFPSNAARALTDAEDRYHFRESVFIESELVPDWCTAHGISQ